MIKLILSRSFGVLKKKPFVLWGISLLNILLGVVASILGGNVPFLGVAVTLLLETSMTMIYLRGIRGEEVRSLQLFECFRDWQTIKRVLCGMGWMSLWIFLWALIPFAGIVFAIIRGYEYRLVPYILVHEPDVSPTEALKVSKERTAGYKGKMFWTDALMYLIPMGISLTLTLLGLIRPHIVGVLFGTVPNVIISILVGIVRPLVLGLINAAWYEEIMNPTVIEPPAPPAPPVGATNFCPNCGVPVTQGSIFCANCGHKLQ